MHQAPALSSALSALYVGHDGGPFTGYPMNTVFEHGVRTQVADIKATSPAGCQSLVMQQRYPAVFHEAVVLPADKETRARYFGTGSGTEAAQLLHRLLTALASDQARLDHDYAYDSAVEVVASSNEDGRTAELLVTDDQWYVVALDEASSLFGAKPPMSVYVRDQQLAKDVAAAFAEGMLDMTPAKKAELLKFGL